MSPAETVRTVRNFVRWHAGCFDALDEVHEAIANPVGYRRGEGDKREFWIKPVVWAEELCGDEMDPQDVARALKADLDRTHTILSPDEARRFAAELKRIADVIDPLLVPVHLVRNRILSDRMAYLWTAGFIPRLETYPGREVPKCDKRARRNRPLVLNRLPASNAPNER